MPSQPRLAWPYLAWPGVARAVWQVEAGTSTATARGPNISLPIVGMPRTARFCNLEANDGQVCGFVSWLLH